MIARYARPDMAALWSDQARYGIFLDIETLAAEAMAEFGIIPESAAVAIRQRGGFDTGRIAEIEAEVKHDVIAFLTSVAEHVGDDARYLHRGMTSSDVLDTALSLQLSRASDLLLSGLDAVLAALRLRALEHRDTITMGRSHGIHAEPTSFGVKLAGHYAEMARNRARLLTAREEIAVCALSGAVGSFSSVDPRVEARVAQRLGLRTEPVSTQIIPRDRHAAFFCTLAVIAGGIERIAVEIRHLQRTEVGEVEEYFSGGQKGSSAMPHKRNPVLSENLTGLARLVRSCAIPALENIALWHERDISHSSVERGIAPDACIHLDFALHRLADLVENLVIHPDVMRANIDRLKGLHCSQRVLLALADAGMSREHAYRAVQDCAHRAFHGDGDFFANLAADPDIARHLGVEAVADLSESDHFLSHSDQVIARALSASG